MPKFERMYERRNVTTDSDRGMLRAMCVRQSTAVGTEGTALICCHIQNSSTMMVWDGRECSGAPTSERWYKMGDGTADSDRGLL